MLLSTACISLTVQSIQNDYNGSIQCGKLRSANHITYAITERHVGWANNDYTKVLEMFRKN